MRARLLLTFLLLLGAARLPAPTVLESCFLAFATLSTEEAPTGLILKTHDELLRELGAGRMAPASRDRWIESRNPFRVPESEEREFWGLQSKLTQFERMLSKRGWVTPELTDRLVQQLREFAAAATDSEAKGEVALEQSISWTLRPPDFTDIPIDVHPGGGWVLIPVHSRQSQSPRSIGGLFDVGTLKQTDYHTALGNFRGAAFTSTGDAVMFGDEGNSIQLVPFKKGKLEWTGAEFIGEKKTKPSMVVDQLEKFGRTTNPNVVYASGPSYVEYSYRFDLKEKTRTPIKHAEYLAQLADRSPGRNEILQWGTVPHTDRMYQLIMTKKEIRLHEVTVDELGNLTKVDATPVWDRTTMKPEDRIHSVTYSSDGKHTLFVEGFRVSYLDANRVVSKLDIPAGVVDPQNPYSPTFVGIHPHSTEAVILLNNRTGATRIEIVNLLTKQSVKSTTVQVKDGSLGFSRVTFLPDGKTILFGSRESVSWNYDALKSM